MIVRANRYLLVPDVKYSRKCLVLLELPTVPDTIQPSRHQLDAGLHHHTLSLRLSLHLLRRVWLAQELLWHVYTTVGFLHTGATLHAQSRFKSPRIGPRIVVV